MGGGGGQLQQEVGVARSAFPLVAATYRRMVYLAPTPALPEVGRQAGMEGACCLPHRSCRGPTCC